MKRNTTTIYLESTNAITPLLWLNNAPDFTGFEEPTLSVLQKAWKDFLESGKELEVIPDPEYVTAPAVPDWAGFVNALHTPTINDSLYGIIEHKVQQAFITASIANDELALVNAMTLRTHWYNCSIGITTPEIRSPLWLSRAWSTLLDLLESNKQPLTSEEIALYTNLFAQFNLA